ncbi:unnamed protein product, partial [Scytosiphon promiscuus]
MLSESKGDNDDADFASQSNPPAIRSLNIAGRTWNSRDLSRGGSEQRQGNGQPGGSDTGNGDAGSRGGGVAAAGDVDPTGSVTSSSATDGARALAKESIQKASSLTAKVFAAARTDRSSGARSSGAMSSAGSAAGTAPSTLGGCCDNASPENLSPTTTSTEALPARGVRRQGDSHLQKLFRTANDGGGGSPSQPSSPSARALPKDGSNGSNSLLEASVAATPGGDAEGAEQTEAANTPLAGAAITSTNAGSSSA